MPGRTITSLSLYFLRYVFFFRYYILLKYIWLLLLSFLLFTQSKKKQVCLIAAAAAFPAALKKGLLHFLRVVSRKMAAAVAGFTQKVLGFVMMFVVKCPLLFFFHRMFIGESQKTLSLFLHHIHLRKEDR